MHNMVSVMNELTNVDSCDCWTFYWIHKQIEVYIVNVTVHTPDALHVDAHCIPLHRERSLNVGAFLYSKMLFREFP